MKQVLAAALSLLLLLNLTACGDTSAQVEETQTQQTEQFVFTRENFPRLNGSTAMVPLGQAIASVLLGETREEVADLINFSRTTQSYRELMYGQADLLISGAPPEGIYAETGMGCTGPVILISDANEEKARQILAEKDFIG